MTEDIWKVTEEDELWGKKWIGYKHDGKAFGGLILIVNGTPELIKAVTKAFYETVGEKTK